MAPGNRHVPYLSPSIENLDQVPSPALLVFPDRARENARRMIAMVGDVARLRPHVKTHKMAEATRLQLELGITKFKCATIAEAEMVAQAGGQDVLLAFQPVGPHVERLARLAAKYPRARVGALVDDEATLGRVSAACRKVGSSVDMVIDIDNGMHRSGIAPGPAAAELYAKIGQHEGLRPGGLHIYDGHIRDQDLQERIRHVEADFAPVQALAAQLVERGLGSPRLIAGGTPTFPAHALKLERECSPGTCVLWDTGYATKFPDLKFEHAALLLTRVASKPMANRLCLDLGYKAVSPDNPAPRVELFDIPDAVAVMHNEEHLTIETRRAADFQVGDTLLGIPFHVCPTCALHREAYVVRDGRVTETWSVTARDRALSI